MDERDQTPSAVRKRVLASHGRLRKRMHSMIHRCDDLRAGDAGAVDSLRDEAQVLLDELLEHHELEERELAPVLRETPGFGEVRVEELVAHHREQRHDVILLVQQLEGDKVDLNALADRVSRLLDEIRRDLVFEDRELLGSDVLKDDPIDVSLSG